MNKSQVNGSNGVQKVLPPIYSKLGDKGQDDILLEELTAFAKTHENKISWSKVFQALNHWMNIPHDKLTQIQDIVEIVYWANLLLEEVKETVTPTNGVPNIFCNNGNLGSTINGAHYATFIALEKTAYLNGAQATRVFSEQIAEIYRGQGLETRWQDAVVCPTEEEYYQMTKRRTASIFELAVRLMQGYTNKKVNFSKLFEILGFALHVADSYKQITCDDYEEEKDFCGDLSNGRFSFPIVHAIQTHVNEEILLRIFRKRPTDMHIKKYFVSLLENCGTIDYTREKLEQLHEDALQEVKKLGGNPLMDDVISQLFQDVL